MTTANTESPTLPYPTLPQPGSCHVKYDIVSFGGAFWATVDVNDASIEERRLLVAWLDDECGEWGAYAVTPSELPKSGWLWSKVADLHDVKQTWVSAVPSLRIRNVQIATAAEVTQHAEFLAAIYAADGGELVRRDV